MSEADRTNGFSIRRDVLRRDECDQFLTDLETDIRSRSAGSRNLFASPTVKRLATDSRLMSIARDFLDSEPIPYKAILFDKSEACNWLVVWHQDRVLPIRTRFADSDWGPWTIKDGVQFAQAPVWAMEQIVALRLHLDDSTENNGPLRVIPGTHTLGVLDQNDVVTQAKLADAVTCTVTKGGVIAMRPLLIHSSTKSVSSSPRRVIHIEYTRNLRLSETIHLALS
jgi:ectoine hydroxylase-related dioxygenase (phytanoyl-CoA dioxygenase family)